MWVGIVWGVQRGVALRLSYSRNFARKAYRQDLARSAGKRDGV